MKKNDFVKEKENHFPVIEKLHTDILSTKYGNIVAKVLVHDNVSSERIRIAKLVDKDDVLRTYALTFLTYDKSNNEIFSIDEEIRMGGLIGETFRKHGYTIKKNVIDVFIMDIPKWMTEDFNVRGNKAKARLTEFYAKSPTTNPLIYGIVLEIYSPDFKDPEDGINQVDMNQINPTTGSLQDSGVPMDEIRKHLDRASTINNEWNDDLKERYKQAKKVSKGVVRSLHNKIKKHLKKI